MPEETEEAVKQEKGAERQEAEQQQVPTSLSDSVRGTAAHHFQLEPNQIVDDRFRVLNEIGRGGMGIVYRVEQLALGREMALKTISGENVSDITWRRFQQEAKAAGMLDHPNLITVHDCGLLEERHPYFVMDLVDGITLSDLIKEKGPLQVEEALPLFIQVCFGLAYAHDLGIIHRDIKPSNIILVRPHAGSTAFNVKIVDFGIAKLATHETSDTQGLTKTGEIFGSPLYMSPEQCLGIAVDARSDIYSVGCVLFEALTGLPPFLGNTALSTMMKHQSDRTPTLKEATLGKEFPAALEQIIARLLEKEPGQRYQTLKAVAHDLSLLQQGISSPTLLVDARKLIPSSERKLAIKETAGFCLLTFVLTAALVSLVMQHNFDEERKEEKATADRAAAQGEKMSMVVPRIDDAIDRANADQRQITSIVPGPFNSIMRRFDFKDRMGFLKWSSVIHPRVAIGVLDVPLRDDVRLTIEDPTVVQNPHLFSRFNRDDLAEVCLSRNTGVTDATFTDIGRLKTLKILEISHCFVTDAVIDRLNELPTLQMVDLSTTQVTAAGLARLQRIKQLSALVLEHFENTKQVLEALNGSRKMISLTLSSTDIKDEDFALFNSMPALNTLFVDTNRQITDKGIALLRGHKGIAQLNISRTSCTSKVVDTLVTLPNLTYLSVTQHLFTPADADRLKRRFPKLRVFGVPDEPSWKEKAREDVLQTIESDDKSGKLETRMLDLR